MRGSSAVTDMKLLRPIALGLSLFVAHAEATSNDFCSDLADRIRNGSADGPLFNGGVRVLKVLAARIGDYAQLDEGDTGEIALDAFLLQELGATAEFREAMMVHFDFDHTNVHLLKLGDSGAGALKSIEGTLRCENLVFFDTARGRIQEVMPPTWYPTTDTCADKTWVGEVGKVPAAMTEHDNSTTSEM